MAETIHFFKTDVPFAIPGKRIMRRWLEATIRNEKRVPGSINIIICSDKYLLKLNKKFLKKTTLTDIITFPMSENEQVISGDLYISIERVRENSKLFKQQTKKELARVILHGVLHLMGYDDQKAKDIQQIRKKEDEYLKKLALW